MCVGYFFVRSASLPRRDEVTTGPTVLNMTNNIFPLVSNVIIPKVLTLFYSAHYETLAVVYWNLYVVLKYYAVKLRFQQ